MTPADITPDRKIPHFILIVNNIFLTIVRNSHRVSLLHFFIFLDIQAFYHIKHGLRTPREEIAFTAQPKIHSHSQIFRYGRSIFCLSHRPNFSDIFDLCFHWVSVVRANTHWELTKLEYLDMYHL